MNTIHRCRALLLALCGFVACKQQQAGLTEADKAEITQEIKEKILNG